MARAVGSARSDRAALGDDPARLARDRAGDSATIRGILLEIFNEPKSASQPRDWKTWQAGMQPLIDLLRKPGSQNVLLVGGVQYSRSFENAPVLDDPLGQLGYAVHPSSGEYNQTRADWQKKFGDFAETHPVMATEFNAQAGGGYCRPELPEQAAALIDYLHEKRIGLVAWALDMPNLREADGSYTTLDHLVCGERRNGGTGGAGRDDPRVLPGQLMAPAPTVSVVTPVWNAAATLAETVASVRAQSFADWETPARRRRLDRRLAGARPGARRRSTRGSG